MVVFEALKFGPTEKQENKSTYSNNTYILYNFILLDEQQH